MANELVARNGLRVSGSTFLGSVSTDQSLTATVLAIDPSDQSVKQLSLTAADIHITGGTLTGTGDKDLQLVNSTGGTVTISDVNIETTGGTYNSSLGVITFTQNDGSTFNVNGWSYVESVTESNNNITVTLNDGSASAILIDAVTGLGYDGDWALSGTSTGVSAPSVELPFITGGTYDSGTSTITLGINGGLESDITITGLDGSDTFVTGATLATGALTLTRNDGNTVTASGFTLNTAGTSGTGSIDLGGTLTFTSTDGSVTVSDNGSGTMDIQVGAGVDTYITGGTYTDNTGVLTLTDNGGTVVTIDGNWNHLESAAIAANVITFTSNTGQTSTVTVDAMTGGTFDLSTGTITSVGSGTLSDITLGTDFVTGVTESNNVITVTKNGGSGTDLTIDAITGLGYDGDWGLSGTSTGVSAPAVELPFITGATLDLATGTLDLVINGGLENTISIAGFSTTNSDTFVTGTTVDYSGATLDRNDGNSVNLTSEQTLRVTRTGTGTIFTVAPADYKAVHVEYTITEGTAARSGFFTAIFHNSSVEYSDFSTVDIGSFSVSTELSADSSGNVIFTGAAGAVVIANTRAVAI